ncbi:MAG: DUF5110 domain-containing protein, partial [Bacteroidaceae bacterium]|nr:DUF5110 domain-containing protein [Bacteroidaceae bacterium]
NLHPADGIGKNDQNFSKMCSDMGLSPTTTDRIPWQLEDSTFYRTFFKNLMRVREKEGVDFWWLDWQQDLTSAFIPGLGQTFWLNHVYYNDMKNNREDRRPIIFHRWGGMGSHRYPLGFSGDTFATYGTLQFESYFTATAANVCFGYWGHDGGGYLQPAECATDPELVLRWMQFCVFQPIFRTHGSSQSSCERRVWKLNNLDLQREAFNLRYTLVPYIYTCAREAYDTGVSICRPLYYEWPEENKAYSTEDEYLFGSDILVAPIATPAMSNGLCERKIWLPEGKWYDVCRRRMVDGNREFTDSYALNEIPYFIRQGAIIPCQSVPTNLKQQPDKLVLWVIPGDEGEGKLYEDQGDDMGYERGEFATCRFTQKNTSFGVKLHVETRRGTCSVLPSDRNIQLIFFAMDKPLEVRLDGATLGTWTYDESLRQLTVELPTLAAAEEADVEVVTSTTGMEKINKHDTRQSEYYSVGGVQHTAPQRGINIIRNN